MLVSYKWLNEWIDLSDLSPEEVADKLTNAGLEVDGIIRLGEGLDKVVLGKVIAKDQHPDADRLSVCQVDVGQEEKLQIVCGAANVAAGQLVPIATIGAVLPGDFKIKKSKLRGVESQGMICSAQELGLDSKFVPKELQEGIYVFADSSYPLGTDIKKIMDLDDVILDIDLTPNRSDCLSMRGVAYELSALYERPVNEPESKLEENQARGHISDLIKLDIQAPELCPRYAGRIVKNVKIAPSPAWLQTKLQAAGIRSINNIVDITNLILLEYGQPLHAFDYNKISGQEIIVRQAKADEIIKTLDDTDRRLEADMLVIADRNAPIAIAGVMGGYDSEVTDETRDIFIESAYFESGTVRKTSTHFGLRSEASIRFEKGTDPDTVIRGLNRAASLMVDLAGGELVEGIVDANYQKLEAKIIKVKPSRINDRLGTDLSKAEMLGIFDRLGFTSQNLGEEIEITIPSRRQDINIFEDLTEEIARIYGYDKIPTTLPVGESSQGQLTRDQSARRRLRNYMISAGWDEAVSYSFINPKSIEELGLVGEKYEQMVGLKMPMSEERSHLRTSMMPSLLELAEYNNNHKNYAIKLFELGKIFLPESLPLKELPEEKVMLAGISYGKIDPLSWAAKRIDVDFYYIKGLVEGVLAYFGLDKDKVSYEAREMPAMHPGQTGLVSYNGQELGYLGQVHPRVAKLYDLPRTFYFELDYEAISSLANLEIKVKSLPRYPAMHRDLALVLDREVEAESVAKSIKKAASDLLKEVTLFDVYTGVGVSNDKKSLAFSLKFSHNDKTLTDEEVEKDIAKIIKAMEAEWQASLRS